MTQKYMQPKFFNRLNPRLCDRVNLPKLRVSFRELTNDLVERGYLASLAGTYKPAFNEINDFVRKHFVTYRSIYLRRAAVEATHGMHSALDSIMSLDAGLDPETFTVMLMPDPDAGTTVESLAQTFRGFLIRSWTFDLEEAPFSDDPFKKAAQEHALYAVGALSADIWRETGERMSWRRIRNECLRYDRTLQRLAVLPVNMGSIEHNSMTNIMVETAPKLLRELMQKGIRSSRAFNRLCHSIRSRQDLMMRVAGTRAADFVRIGESFGLTGDALEMCAAIADMDEEKRLEVLEAASAYRPDPDNERGLRSLLMSSKLLPYVESGSFCSYMGNGSFDPSLRARKEALLAGSLFW